MTHHGPPGHPRRGGANTLTWILSVVGVAVGVVFAVTGLVVAGLAVYAVVGMNFYGSNK